MQVTNELSPRVDQIAKLLMDGPEGPIFMVNLLKFKPRAVYKDGRATELTGRQAYDIYAAAVSRLLPKFGGKAMFAADVSFLALGRVEELWDEVAIAMYPARAALIRMSRSAEWREIEPHREAGLAGQLNIETVLVPGFRIDWSVA
jgi:hypothetical protein